MNLMIRAHTEVRPFFRSPVPKCRFREGDAPTEPAFVFREVEAPTEPAFVKIKQIKTAHTEVRPPFRSPAPKC